MASQANSNIIGTIGIKKKPVSAVTIYTMYGLSVSAANSIQTNNADEHNKRKLTINLCLLYLLMIIGIIPVENKANTSGNSPII